MSIFQKKQGKTQKFSIKIGQLFSILLAFIVTILISYNYHKTYQISYLLLQKVQNETTSHIIKMTSEILDISSNNIEILSKIDEKNDDILSNKAIFIALMYEHLKVYDYFHSIYIANALGDFIQVRREPFLEARVVHHDKQEEEIFQLKGIFELNHRATDTSLYSPLNRLWYTLANEENRTFWSKPYLYAGFNELGITASRAIFNQGRKTKVVGVDITYERFNQFVKQQSRKINGEIVIFDKEQYVFASSFQTQDTQDKKVLKLQDIHSSLLTKAYQEGKKEGLIVDDAGVNYLYFFEPFPENAMKDWHILTLIPEESILGEIKKTMYHTILISFLIFLLSILIIAYSSHKISKPIRKISKEIKLIESLNFKVDIEQNSNITEISEVQASLKSLQKALHSFSKYLPIELVKILLEVQDEAKIGGEERELAFMFTDIENFTTLSEKMPPTQVAQQLSEYFETISTIIKKNEGTVDKYIGDAILAFWGAPKAVKNPISLAVKTLIEIEYAIKILNKQWEKEGKAPFKTRIGLHYGKALVGNIGSNDRLNYTVIGDNVNTTARIEAINKKYQTYNIITQTIYEKMLEPYPVKYLGTMKLKGKQEATKLYTLIL